MARVARIQRIRLEGWNTGDDVPQAWLTFVDEERAAGDVIVEWMDI